MGEDEGQRTDRVGHIFLMDTKVTQILMEIGLERNREPRTEPVSFYQRTIWE